MNWAKTTASFGIWWNLYIKCLTVSVSFQNNSSRHLQHTFIPIRCKCKSIGHFYWGRTNWTLKICTYIYHHTNHWWNLTDSGQWLCFLKPLINNRKIFLCLWCRCFWAEIIIISSKQVVEMQILGINLKDKSHGLTYTFVGFCKHWWIKPWSLINTWRPRYNCHHLADNSLKCILLNENVWISCRISLKFVRNVRINNIKTLVQIMAWLRPGNKPSSEPMVVSFLTHICITRPQWIISLLSNDAMGIVDYCQHWFR